MRSSNALTPPPVSERDPAKAYREFMGETPTTTLRIKSMRAWHEDHLEIVLPGEPMGAVRQNRSDAWKQRPAVLRYREFRDRLRDAAGEVPDANDVLRVDIEATFEPPKSWPKKKRLAAIGELHRVRPDKDNIEKAVTDCLWRQDAAIADGRTTKRWGWEAKLVVRIYVNPLE